MVHPDNHTNHPDNMVEANKPDPDSPLYTLASVSAELLKDAARASIPTLAQGMSHENNFPLLTSRHHPGN